MAACCILGLIEDHLHRHCQIYLGPDVPDGRIDCYRCLINRFPIGIYFLNTFIASFSNIKVSIRININCRWKVEFSQSRTRFSISKTCHIGPIDIKFLNDCSLNQLHKHTSVVYLLPHVLDCQIDRDLHLGSRIS